MASTVSDRERVIAEQAALGRSNKLIAYELGIAESTVATHLAAARRKLGARSRVEVARKRDRSLRTHAASMRASIVAAVLASSCSFTIGAGGGFARPSRLRFGEEAPCAHRAAPIVDGSVAAVAFLLTVAFLGGVQGAAGGTVSDHSGAGNAIAPIEIPGAVFLASAIYGQFENSACADIPRETDVEAIARTKLETDALASARSGDCAAVHAFALQIEQLDPDGYKTQFLVDAAVAGCLGVEFCTRSQSVARLCYCAPKRADCDSHYSSFWHLGAAVSECEPIAGGACPRG